MAFNNLGDFMPQWKKDLILRRRNQHKQSSLSSSQQQLSDSSCSSTTTAAARNELQSPPSVDVSGQQPSPTIANNISARPCVAQSATSSAAIMVQERAWIDHGVNVLVKKNTADNNAMGNGTDIKNIDSDSSEELQYGPGIVSKLKNRYLSLTLRETSNRRTRPSILHMRKAASLENLLEDDAMKSPINNNSGSNGNSAAPPHSPYDRCHRPANNASNGTVRNASNRYRNSARGHDMMKRAHSVETISLRTSEDSLLQLDADTVATMRDRKQKCESLYNDNTMILIDDGNYNKKEASVISDYQNAAKVKKMYDSGVAVNNIPTPRLNRPTKIKPIMNEKEKPPADVVKEAKKKFEGRPDLRTRPPHQTGDVAAKIASYSNIIVKTKVSKMPLASKHHKPNAISNKATSWSDKKESKPTDLKLDHKWSNTSRTKTINSPDVAMVSPIPDISRVTDTLEKFERDNKVNSSLSETPDLLIHSSPVHTPINSNGIITNRERSDSNSTASSQPLSPASQTSSQDECEDIPSMRISADSQYNVSKASNSEAFNFNNILMAAANHLPVLDRKPPTPPHNSHSTNNHQQKPPSHTEPLRLEINARNGTVPKQSYEQLLKKSPTNGEVTPVLAAPISPTLTSREIEKNSINAAKSRDAPVLVVDINVPKPSSSGNSTVVSRSSVDNVKNVVPKPKKPVSQPEDTTTLFDFTHRNDVPDYVRNDGTTRSIDIPKSKDSGITFLAGYEEELDIDLSSPPSPCDVTFINDNVLISGRSSISKRPSKRVSLQKIQFNTSPEVFEYPSEKSIIGEEREDVASPSVGHTVPLLSGSTLANYQPKSGFSIEEFQLGVTKTAAAPVPEEAKTEPQTVAQIQEPIMFSAGTNSDILF